MLKDLNHFFVGYDRIAQRMNDIANQATTLASKYPPFNLKKIDDNKYVIELAVAGFSKQDLEIELADDKLVIKGNVKSGESAEQDSKGEWTWPQILYQGLAMRPFTRTFNVADNVEIRGANLVNGILRIGLEAIIPEHKKPKKIDIGDGESSSTKAELLTEEKG